MNRNRQRHADRSLPILSAAMLSVGGLLWQGACSAALAQSSSDVIVNYDVLNSLPGQAQPAPATPAPSTPAVILQQPSSDGSQPTVAAAVTPPEAPSEMPAAVPMPEATPPAPPPAASAAPATAAVEAPTAPVAPVETPEAPAEEPAPVAAVEPPAVEPAMEQPAEQPEEVPPQEAAQQPPAPEQPAQEEPAPEPTAEQSTAETPPPEPSAESESAPQPVEPPKAAEAPPAEAAQTEEQPSEEQSAEEAAAEPEPDNNRPAAPVPAGGIRIVYPVELNDVPVEANGALDDLAAQMAADETMRIQIKCYASGNEDTESKARRRALARCINIRQYLYQKQILTTRMDVRALGLKSEGQPADRVDIVPANS